MVWRRASISHGNRGSWEHNSEHGLPLVSPTGRQIRQKPDESWWPPASM